MTGGRAPSFHDLSVGEAPAPSEGEENGGGGKFPSQRSPIKMLKDSMLAGCSKTSRCKAPEILRSEAYKQVRRSDER